MLNFKILSFLLLLPATAYTKPFTILAKSGLNVRKAPSATSEKVASLPFGTVIDADLNYEIEHYELTLGATHVGGHKMILFPPAALRLIQQYFKK